MAHKTYKLVERERETDRQTDIKKHTAYNIFNTLNLKHSRT